MNESKASENNAKTGAPRLSRKWCPICSEALTVHQEVRGGVCDNPVCRRKYVVVGIERRKQEQLAALRQAAFAYRDRLVEEVGARDAESLRLTIVPVYAGRLKKLPSKRRKEFRAHLATIIRQALEEAPDAASLASLETELTWGANPYREDPAVQASCAVCKGFCCRRGGSHAYLSVAVIRAFIAQNPKISRRKIMKTYIDKLPGMSFEDSCVYQGARGCGLPTEMRSSTCNSFFCSSLKDLRAEISATGPKSLLVVAADGEKIMRSAIIKPSGRIAQRRIEHMTRLKLPGRSILP